MTEVKFNNSKVDNTYINSAKQTNDKETKNDSVKDSLNVSEKENRVADNEAAVYEKTETPAKNSVYSINKMNSEERASIVERLKAENEARVNQLFEIVNQMLTKQSGVVKLADLFSPENLLNVSEKDILQAKEDISEDGYWGVKQTSQRMFDFACALAGDDVEKMKEMQAAMEKGFNKAKEAWGGELPSICNETIDAANKLFEDYFASKGV